ncbi:MAG: S41 family peptidase [Oscillospiraceae bacterium]|nr:S41 family peptidase [Oscillospiraceae bacterium]
MNKRVSLGAALALMLLVAAVTFNITFDFVNNQVNDRMIDLREREENLEMISMLNRMVRANFNGVIDEIYLMDSIARGFIAGIGDPYAVFHDARTYEAMLRAQASPTAGIGALLRANPEGDGYILVEEVFADSPALAAGMLAGDLIIRVDDEDLTPENSVQMLESISGDTGSRVSLTIRSNNIDRTEDLLRRIVPLPTVYSRMLSEPGVGYIQILDFNQHTPDQFRRERDRMLAAGAQSLIFDLRDVSSGQLVYAARILDTLVPPGVIVSSRDRDGNDSVLFNSSSNQQLDMPMVTLINAGTTGPAELFTQVLRDRDRARSVGTSTAGKGVVQEIIPLVDGSAIEITTALLVTPSGVIFNGVGLRPDYEVAFDGEWQNLDEHHDPQLSRAVELSIALHRVSDALEQQAQEEAEQEAEQASADVEDLFAEAVAAG